MDNLKIIKLTKNKLYLSNEEILDISPDIIYNYKLKKDMIISDIYEDILYDSIKQKAFYYIYLKPRTKYELKSKLKGKYTNFELIEEVINYLDEEKYISDVDYAISYILTRRNSKRKNVMKLLQKGISKKDIDTAYLDIPSHKETDLIKDEVQKLINSNQDKAKIIVKLMRKGYEYNSIKEILDDFR